MYNSQRYPLNLCLDKNEVGAGRLEVTVYTVLSVHCTLVYTGAVSWHYINRNIWYPWSNKGLKGIVVNRTFHSKNWRSLENTLTIPLCSSEILILFILCRFINLAIKFTFSWLCSSKIFRVIDNITLNFLYLFIYFLNLFRKKK